MEDKYKKCIGGFRDDWEIKTDLEEMDKKYKGMAEKYCRTAHLERKDDDNEDSQLERRSELKK